MRKNLESGLQRLSINASEQQVQHLLDYLELLVKWNNTHNLTAITDANAMVDLHLLDSLSILKFIKGPSLLDVGSGAGFPGVVIAIMRPDLHVSSIDSRGKKIQFQTLAASNMGLENFTTIHSRVENLRVEEPFAQIVSRAFASLNNFIDWTKHLLTDDGEWLAMKGQLPTMELEELKHSQAMSPIVTHALDVPNCIGERHLLIFKQ